MNEYYEYIRVYIHIYIYAYNACVNVQRAFIWSVESSPYSSTFLISRLRTVNRTMFRRKGIKESTMDRADRAIPSREDAGAADIVPLTRPPVHNKRACMLATDICIQTNVRHTRARSISIGGQKDQMCVGAAGGEGSREEEVTVVGERREEGTTAYANRETEKHTSQVQRAE